MASFVSHCALVTGASQGIGLAIALALARQGAWVAGTATTLKGAQDFSSIFSNLKLQGQGFVLNVCDIHSIQTLVECLTRLNKLPNILINNAGVVMDAPMIRLRSEQWHAVMNVNAHAIFDMTRRFLVPMLHQRYGRIITIGSVIASIGNIGQTNYAASKAAVIGFSKSLALEVARYNITVNTISPGFIQTNMTKSLSPCQKEKILEKIPLQRFGLPDDIASACLFLSSKDSHYITGFNLHVNGGLFME